MARYTIPRLPIEGLPEVRPKCATCGRTLKPKVRNHWDGHPPEVVRKSFDGWHGHPWSGPVFCRQLCVLRFAMVCYRKGLRLKPQNETIDAAQPS